MSNLERQFFIDNGFLLYQSLLLPCEILESSELIDNALKNSGIPKTKEDANSIWVPLKSKLQNNKIIVNMIHNEKIQNILNILLGDKTYNVGKSCQIATRFPGENCMIDNDGKIVIDASLYKNWNIDNFTKKDFERKKLPSEFTCIVGIFTSD